MKRQHRQNGFTLIELLISIGLFALIATLVTTTFFYLIHLQRSIDSKQQILNDFRSSLDVLSKEVASGSAFPTNCQNGCPNIMFTTQTRPDLPLRWIEYRFDAAKQQILKSTQTTFGLCQTVPFDPNCFQPITSSKIKISSFEFYINNPGSYSQPIITAEIQGTILPGNNDTQTFSTAVSLTPRLIQNPSAIPLGSTPPPPAPTGDNIPPTVTITSPTSQGTFTTDQPTITLGGTASDDVGVGNLYWRNLTTGDAAFLPCNPSASCSWITAPITLFPGVPNDINVYAGDQAGLWGTARILVTTTATASALPAPIISVGQPSCGGVPYLILYASCNTGGDQIMWYRCNGLCTPADPGDYLITGNCSGTGDLTSQTGNQYTYSAKSCLSSTGLCSAMSSPYTVTVQPPPTTCNPPPPPPPPPSSGSFTISYGSSIPVVTAFVTGDPNTYAESQTTGLTVIPQNGYSLAVYYTLTSTFPINAKPKVLPNPVYGPPYSTSQFSVVIPNNTPLGQYTLTVLATGQDGQTQEVPIYLYVGAAATGST